MNVAAQVASRVVEIVKNAWYGSGWTAGTGSNGGSEGAHKAQYTCLLASGYKAAYQEMEHIKEAKDHGKQFYGGLHAQDPVMDLVEKSMARAIQELYPEYGKGQSWVDPSSRTSLVMGFNDSYANHEMAVAVAERAQEFIEQEARVAELIRNGTGKDIPKKFSFTKDESDSLVDEINEMLSLDQREESALMEQVPVEEKKDRKKAAVLEQ